MTLTNYKGFVRTVVSLGDTSVLVGANNAGKSTVVGALRLAAASLPLARARGPNTYLRRGMGRVAGWSLSAAAVEAAAFTSENVRYDFRLNEARVEVEFTSGAVLALTWPQIEEADADDEPPAPVLTMQPPSGDASPPRLVAQMLVPQIGVVPTLTPVDDRELVITAEALRRNITSRRTSRYFRNALWATLLQGQWDDLEGFILDTTPEIEGLSVAVRNEGERRELDVFYQEARGRERELTWAGDGLQIWLQAMYHLWRERDRDVIVLDEPDVFLHPDLQRRLARRLFSMQGQKILATHSLEVLAEAPPASAVWVDRTRSSSERPRRSGALGMLGRRLGSGLELGIARALRSRLALFVEGQDMRFLAHMAEAVGARRLSNSAELAVIPLGGFDRRQLASASAEVMAVLGADVSVEVLLDRDLRDDVTVERVNAELRASGAGVHVWQRKEIESYLLAAEPLSRCAGLAVQDAQRLLDASIEGLADETRVALVGRRLENAAHRNQRTVMRAAEDEFKTMWSDPDDRLRIVAPKDVLTSVNRTLQNDGRPAVSARALAASATAQSLTQEVHDVLLRLERLLA